MQLLQISITLLSGIAIGMSILLITTVQSISNTNNSFTSHTSPNTTVLGSSKKNLPVSTVSANLALNPQIKVEVIPASIIEIVDINSVKVLLNDGLSVIDLIGIKPPDESQSLKYEKCYKEKSSETLKKLFLGKKVFILGDIEYSELSAKPKYVFLEDISSLNQEIIEEGFGLADAESTYLYKEEYLKYEVQAMKNAKGIWLTDCKAIPTSNITSTKKLITPTPASSQNLYSKLLISPTPQPISGPKSTVTSTPQELTVTSETSKSKPSSLNPEILFTLINNHRRSINKPSFEKDDKLCTLAVSRGPELYDEIFVTHNMHSGLYNRNLPYWITENMAHYSSEEQVFNWWMASALHRRAIESDSKYSCGECFGNSCAQLFSSFTPK